MKRYLSYAAAVVLAVAGYVWFAGARPSVSPPKVADQSARGSSDAVQESSNNAALNEALLRQLAALRAEVDELRKNKAPTTADLAPAMADPERKAAPVDEKELERQREEWHGRIAEVEAAFQEEARDPSWSSQVRQSVQQVFKEDRTLSERLQKVECRSRTCRLELSDDGPEPVSEIMMPALLQLSGSLPKVQSDQITDAAGRKTVVLYMKRRAEG